MIDSHAHLTSPEMLPDIKEILVRAKESGVEKIVNICTDETSLQEGIKLKQQYPMVFNTAATTPHDVEKEGEFFFSIVEKSIKELVAIGETGLDYFYEHSPKKIQQHFLQKYLQLAISSHLPIIFHCRDAFSDLFSICDEQYQGQPAVLHCFTGTLKDAKECLDRGWYISFSGIITFKKSEALREIVKSVPLDRIFIETDAPYLAPQKQRGKRNEPSFVVETAEKIAELKGVSLEQIEETTTKNIYQFFALN